MRVWRRERKRGPCEISLSVRCLLFVRLKRSLNVHCSACLFLLLVLLLPGQDKCACELHVMHQTPAPTKSLHAFLYVPFSRSLSIIILFAVRDCLLIQLLFLGHAQICDPHRTATPMTENEARGRVFN